MKKYDLQKPRKMKNIGKTIGCPNHGFLRTFVHHVFEVSQSFVFPIVSSLSFP